MTFERWAEAVTEVIEDKLGMKNVASEVYVDHAVWQSKANRGVARPEDDGKHVSVVFDRGRGHLYALADGAEGAAAEIVGRLLGLV
ncbi:MAG: hypothetical protein ABSH03_16630 [Candidatus Lustribacter sp.]